MKEKFLRKFDELLANYKAQAKILDDFVDEARNANQKPDARKR